MPGYNSYSDDDLLNRLRIADENAFTEIYNRYWEKLLAIGFFHLRSKQAAEDIVHEVMMSLWTRKKELAIQSLSSYLATAVKFAVFKSIVRDKRRRELQKNQALPETLNETIETWMPISCRNTCRKQFNNCRKNKAGLYIQPRPGIND